MWFKNLHIYRFTKPFALTPEALDEKLAEKAFSPCGSQDLIRFGWVPPLGKQGTQFVHAANGYIMICAKRQEKVLPAAVIKEELEEQVEAIQNKEARRVSRKERDSLKEEITFTLLPKAFTRSNTLFAYIAPADGLIVINASSTKRAEELLTQLRDAIDTLPVIPVCAKNSPQHTMTQWLREGQAGKGFELGHECELRDPRNESAVIRCKHQDLSSDEINNHIKTGMYVSKLGLLWSGGIEFMVDDQLAIKRLAFDDVVQEKAQASDAQDAAEQFDADFAIMTLELSGLFKGLMGALGGEDMADCE